MRPASRLILLFLFLPAAGCSPGGPKVAQVSGRITMDNQPLVGAKVYFQPIGTEENQNKPGIGSYGQTDADGRFTLKMVGDNRPGAVVAEHRVEISQVDAPPADDDQTPTVNHVPPRYNRDSQLRRTVPPEGSTEMNFELTRN